MIWAVELDGGGCQISITELEDRENDRCAMTKAEMGIVEHRGVEIEIA